MRIVLSTCRPDEAEKIAEALLQERLVASVNIVPGVRTRAWLEGEIIRQEECLLVMRTRAELMWQLERRYVELNSWKYPEVASLEVQDWNPEYEQWLLAATEPATR